MTDATTQPAGRTTGTVASADGTTIAYRRAGDGPPVVIVGGAFNDAATATPLVEQLSRDFTAYSYDRRGRGSSGDTQPYGPEREIEDLHAVLAVTGGSANLFGHSSGAVLALQAAASAPEGTVAKLALYEPPYTAERGFDENALVDLRALIAEGRRGDAVELFMRTGPQVPDAALAGMRQSPMWPGLERLAHTVPYDVAVVGDGRVPTELAANVHVPVLVMDGGLSPEWAQKAVSDLAAALPEASLTRFEKSDHGVAPELLAPVLKQFFA